MKTNKMITVRIKGQSGFFCQSGFSEFNKRFSLKQKGELNEPIYGVKQAEQHIKELKDSVYMGKKHHENKTFEIIEITTTENILKTV